MSFVKPARLTAIAVTSTILLIATTYASRFDQPATPALGIEIALAKPFYIPAATGKKTLSVMVRTPVTEEYSGREIAAVKLVPIMEGEKVKVTVYALIGDAGEISSIKSCKDWDSFEAVKVDTFVAGLDEEVAITKLRDFGVKFESGDLKVRIVPKKAFPQQAPIGGGGGSCGCGSCGNLQCCPNPGYCISCGQCGSVCCNSGGDA